MAPHLSSQAAWKLPVSDLSGFSTWHILPKHQDRTALANKYPCWPHALVLLPCGDHALAGALLHALCRGLDPSPVRASGAAKSITVEDSFAGCSTWEAVRSVLKVGCGDNDCATGGSCNVGAPRVCDGN